MAVRHLSDEEIQECLEDKHRASFRRLEKHVQTCAHCQAQLQQYQNLFSALKHEPKVNLRFDFADAVIAKVKVSADEAFNLPIWLAFLGTTIGVATTLYFVGLEKLTNFFTTLQGYFAFDWHVISTINKYLSDLHLNLGLLALAIFIIAMMSIIDRFVFQSRHKLISFFK